MAAVTRVTSGVCCGEVDQFLDLSYDPDEWKGLYRTLITRYPPTKMAGKSIKMWYAIIHIPLSKFA